MTGPAWRNLALAALAALLLNGLLAFDNVWPTPAIKPDWRLAPEFIALWVVLVVLSWRGIRVGAGWLDALALAYTALVVGRYFDVTVPALFGRPVNLYWDALQVPQLLTTLSRRLPAWLPAVALPLVVVSAWALFRSIRAAIGLLATLAVPHVLRSTAARVATGLAFALVAANTAGMQATWPFVSKPVAPTYARQAKLLLTLTSPRLTEVALPPSPAFDSDLAVLRGADLKLIFLESYGAVAYESHEVAVALEPARARLAHAIEDAGRIVMSAYFGSPTFAGGSELAHLSLLSGIELRDPFRHDLLLTTSRPTLISMFKARGYETFGLYSSMSWDWPERAFYRFDHYLDGRDLDYRGPKFSAWWIPDQYAIAKFEQIHPIAAGSPPRLVFFPSIASHIPFEQTPPVQPDWGRLLTEKPYDAAEAEAALAARANWLDLRPGYAASIRYSYDWLASYIGKLQTREDVMIALGDHQPAGSVSGPDASWDVPVHVITSNRELVERLARAGFRPGMTPSRPALGEMHTLTQVLLSAFDSRPRSVYANSSGTSSIRVP